ncbi:MAG: hypothetical protein E3J35_00110 [Methanomassiliicoccales archaeon]|nr:MAG: hypothetical protein E3J35_00110 [Methanomassiliicoccales archaeon]
MHREETPDNLEDLKSYFHNKSDVEVDEGDIFILACALEQPLTVEEIGYSTGLRQSICIAKVRKLMEAGLLNRYGPKSPRGQKRGGLFVYQLTDNIACELGALRIESR